MISNPERTVFISSMGWVDRDALWRFYVPTATAKRIRLGSGAQYLSLHSCGSDLFAVGHHFGGARFELTIHSFSDPKQVLASAAVAGDGRKLLGDPETWKKVPRLYVDYLRFAPLNDYVLILVSPSLDQIEVQRLEWYDDTYDKGYQGIAGVLEFPGESSALISVQRSSQLILHDLATGRKNGALELAGRSGNPELYFRSSAQEVWASDYDTMVVIHKRDWRFLRSARLQDAAGASLQFIGSFSFAADENSCVVARPFSGDVVEIDASTLKIKRTAKLRRQPLDVASLAGGEIVARDWKTGAVLRGKLD
ncbi:MAG: hypothetical protein QOF89_6219 [Acidobacteriota bacterium]|jgi:hypothetical protein|nr:hypothetical protein [Acidobacteriota bacterium]